jgi:hypothetical protein
MDGLEIMLNEITQAHDDKCHMFSFAVSKTFKFKKLESRMVVTRGWGPREVGR